MSQSGAGCYSICSLVQPVQGGGRGEFPTQQARSTWHSFSPCQGLPKPPRQGQATGGGEERKAPLSPALSYAVAGVHLCPFPSLQGLGAEARARVEGRAPGAEHRAHRAAAWVSWLRDCAR